MDTRNPEIGDLRWQVTLCREQQQQDPNGPGIVTTYADEVAVWANIVPVGTMVWLNGVQTEENAVTHRIFIRWRDFLDEYSIVIRDRTRPDGSTKTEVYRIHRFGEIQGRQRFITMDAELRQDVY